MSMFIIVLLMMHWPFCVCCPNAEAKHSLFFMSIDFFDMKSIETDASCVCDNHNCTSRCSGNDLNCLDFDKVYWVQSNTDVYGVIGNSSLGEMFNVLKDDYLGNEYVVSVYLDVSGESFLGVGNPSNSPVTVDIALPQINSYSLTECENSTLNLNLQAYEARTIKFKCDISGTRISASDKVIVYAATFSSMEPNSFSLQFMIEQVIPVNHWGTFYTVVPSVDNAYGDVISVIVSQPNTFVHIQGYDYVIVPEQNGIIRRRIDGIKPITVKSSQPVSVAQFSMNSAGKHVMILNIPVNFDTDVNSLNTNGSYFFNYLSYSAGNQTDLDNSPLTRFFASRKILNPLQEIFGCSVYFENSMHFGGTFCGFLQNTEKTDQRHWPQMVPGDGVDNDNDGSVDEDDCYSSFIENTYSTALDVQDCKKAVLVSDASVKEIFIIPNIADINSPWQTSIRCRINSSASMSYWSNTTQTWITLIQNTNEVLYFQNLNSGEPLIIKSTSENKIHLFCHYECNSINCSNSFFVPSVSELGSRYNAQIPPCPDDSLTCQKQCTISNIFKNTSYSYVNTRFAGTRSFDSNGFTQVPLLYIENGNYIEGMFSFATICFTWKSSNNSALVHYLLPLTSAGLRYNLIKAGHTVDEKLYIWATDSNTLLHMSETDEASNIYTGHTLILYAGDHAVINLATGNIDTYYKFSSNKPVQILAHFKINTTTIFSYSGSNPPFNPDGYNIVRVPSTTSIQLPSNGNLMFRVIDGNTFYPISNSGWPHRSSFQDERDLPRKDLFQIPGDGIDNDKDGLVDEDVCGFLIQDLPSESKTLHDIDLDGSYNEDCRGCSGGSELDSFLGCTLCGIGTFRKEASKIDKCIPCGKNMTTFEEGSNLQEQCVPVCAEGMELNNETMQCRACPIGYYKNVTANDTSVSIQDRFWCKQCPQELTTYDVGTRDPSGCITHCGEGEELRDIGGCQLCDFGFYKNVSSTDLTASPELRWNCTACGVSRTTEGRGTTKETECRDICLEGMELNNMSMSCEPCLIGYYKNVQANDISRSVGERFWCIECPGGQTTYDLGSTDIANCINHCNSGEELVSTGCQLCSVGFYKDVSSSNISAPAEKRWNCTACGLNKTTLDIGTIKKSDCLGHCAEGMFLNGTQCQPCPIGLYKNTSSEDPNLPVQLRWNCTACGPDKTTYSKASRQCIDHCGIGLQLKGGVCTPCEIGFYKNTSSEDKFLTETQRWNCSQCPRGLTTNSTGAQTCVVHCPVGMELLPTNETCQHCRIGFYKDISGSHVDCFQCPVNFTTRKEGALSSQDCKLANCVCPCDRVNVEKNYTSEELSNVIEELKKELMINKAVLSSNIRKKISVMDYRPSAKSIGSVGAILITAVFLLLIGFDIPILKEHLSMLFKRRKNHL